MNRAEYRDYLRSEEWQQRRLKVLEAAGFRCQTCNAPAQKMMLDVHHRTYERVGKEESGDLVALCRKCHQVIHRAVGIHGEMEPLDEPETSAEEMLALILNMLSQERVKLVVLGSGDARTSLREDFCNGYAHGDIMNDMAERNPEGHRLRVDAYWREQEERRKARALR